MCRLYKRYKTLIIHMLSVQYIYIYILHEKDIYIFIWYINLYKFVHLLKYQDINVPSIYKHLIASPHIICVSLYNLAVYNLEQIIFVSNRQIWEKKTIYIFIFVANRWIWGKKHINNMNVVVKILIYIIHLGK